MKCERCKKEFQGEPWQKVCKPCYASSKGSYNRCSTCGQRSITTETSIIRQVLYKVAAELLEKGAPAAKVNDFVKELEAGFYQ
ncbi:hypothetical protein HYV85_02810 [Candidatus Woesearchaeota archaeon]|nr:hypothetical protein [Candidatus Woesearchaeota archaeon]